MYVEGCPGLPSTVLSCTKLSIIIHCIVWNVLYQGRVVGIVSCGSMSILGQDLQHCVDLQIEEHTDCLSFAVASPLPSPCILYSYIISCMHPFFDIHSHPSEMFSFRCTPSLSSIRVARLFQCVSLLY